MGLMALCCWSRALGWPVQCDFHTGGEVTGTNTLSASTGSGEQRAGRCSEGRVCFLLASRV